MKTLITTLNAKYIHTALAIRLLYVASYPKHDVALKEYTIKQKNEDIVQDILSQQVDAVAFLHLYLECRANQRYLQAIKTSQTGDHHHAGWTGSQL